LVFISTRAQLAEAKSSPAQTWVVGKDLEGEVPSSVANLLLSPNPYLAMALVAKRYFPQTRGHQIVKGPAISERATISPTARVGRDCVIGPGAVIGDDVELGDRCIVGANSVLEAGVKVGADTYIHPLVFIAHSCQIGARCEIHPNTSIGTEGYGYAHDQKFNHYRVTHYGRVILEDDVHIGAGVNIDRGTFADSRIGAGTKIDNHCHFGHNIVIGRNTLITAGMITGGSTTIGNACVFGGRATIKGHLSVADRVQIGGISSIGNNVKEAGEYGGHPLQPIAEELRTRASVKELPRLVKDVRRILKHLGL
jgi:UDP-3-O-[3-hydroxymyristoyl] glucosamine N-acyltransferase